MNERQEQFSRLKDSRLKNERFLEEKKTLEQQVSQMHHEDFDLRMRSKEIEILKVRGDIYKLEEELGLDKDDPEVKEIEKEAFEEIAKVEEETMGFIRSWKSGEKELFEEVDKLIIDLNMILEKVKKGGYTLSEFENMENSENSEEQKFFEKIKGDLERLNLADRIEVLKEKDPNMFIDLLIPQINDMALRADFLKDISDNEEIPQNKIIESFIKNIPKNEKLEKYKDVANSIDIRLIEEKRKALLNLPAEEEMNELLQDSNLSDLFNSDVQNNLFQKSSKLCESYMLSKNLDAIQKLIAKILELEKKLGDEDKNKLHLFLPQIWSGLYLGESETLAIFSGNMPRRIFDQYYSAIRKGPFLNLVPEKLLKEKSFHEHLNRNTIDFKTHTVEHINEALNKFELSFSELSTEEKEFILRTGEEKIEDIFSKEDFTQVLNEFYIPIERISPQYRLELKDLIINNFFKFNDSLENFNKFYQELGFKISDLTNEQKNKLLSLNDYEIFSLFDMEDLKNLVLNTDYLVKNIQDLSVDSLKKIFNITGLQIDNFSTEKKMSILKDKKYSEEIVQLFNPEDLKELILNRDSKIERAQNIEEVLNFAGLTIKDFSPTRKAKILDSFDSFSIEKIQRLFSIEDFKEIFKIGDQLNMKLIPLVYYESLNEEIVEYAIKNDDLFFFDIDSKNRNLFLKTLKERTEKNKNFENFEIQQKNVQRIGRIRESFLLQEKNEELPPVILEKQSLFKEKYGKKGEGLIALCIVAYGLENLKETINQIEKIEKVLDLYNQENIPEGMRVSLGIEYEVGDLMGEAYNKKSVLGYKVESELIKRSVNLGRGTGGSGSIYEHYTKPTDNPYLLMTEIQLLQDAGLIDFNFKEYNYASRGYHLNLGGEEGLKTSGDIFFLDNLMTLTGLNGLKLGKEVSSTKGIYEKSLEKVFDKPTVGQRIEIKGMGCDSIEQFNKAILTAHYAGIAIQIIQKYETKMPLEVLLELPEELEDFEEFLSDKFPLREDKFFESKREKQIIFIWLKLKKDMILAVKQNNNSFMNAEFRGFFFKENGEYVETGDDIDVNLNKKFLKDAKMDLDSEGFKKNITLPESLMEEGDNRLVNTLTKINNLFTFKEFELSQNKFYIDKRGNKQLLPEYLANAYSVLTIMNKKGYQKNILGSPFDSILDTGGEIRDGYYYVQGASEEMITHKSQILLNDFNKKMAEILKAPVGQEELKKQEEYERAN